MAEMRILTVRQPWAWAIISGQKDVENRVRNIAGDYRGPVAIHAGLADFEQHNMASEAHRAAHGTETDIYLAFGSIIGLVDLEAVHFSGDSTFDGEFAHGNFGWSCSPWAEPNVWHLELANPRPLTKPIPFKGALGLRKLDAETIARVLEGVTR